MKNILIAFLFSIATAAFAHDPGLSGADIKLDQGGVTAHLTFARADILNLADSLNMESVATSALEVRADGKLLSPRDVSCSDDGTDYHFNLQFPASSPTSLELRSSLITRLARGHRQYMTVRDASGSLVAERMLDARADKLETSMAAKTSAAAARSHSFVEFLKLGVEHIVTGYDHLLFLFGLLIVGGSFRSAAKVITAFTVAHSITLAAATLNLVSFPSRIVEALIAASIVYVGFENLFRKNANWRWLLSFGFGLIHGFGFASILGELGIGTGATAAVPLLSFNLGVELGQIAIATLVLPVIWKLQRCPSYATRYVPVCSLVVALLGGYWLIERTVLP